MSDYRLNNIGNRPLARIYQAFAAIPISVTSLDLTFNALYNKTGAELAQVLAALPAHVTSLNLGNNNLNIKTGAELAQAFSALPASVTSLNLGNNNLDHKTEAELAQALAALPASVTSLNVNDNQIDDESAKALAKNTSLTSIKVGANTSAVNTSLNTRYILRQAWEKTKGNKFPYFLASIMILAINLFLGFIIFPKIELIPYFFTDEKITALFLFLMIIELSKLAIYSFVQFPAVTGLLMMGVNDREKDPKDAIKIFICYKKILKLGLSNFIVGFFIILGQVLFLIHISVYTFLILLFLSIYLPTYYSMTVPLIMKKNLGIWSALNTSKILISRNINKAICLYGAMMLILIISALPLGIGLISASLLGISLISALPLGIGLIWSIPLCCEAYGILYRTLFESNNEKDIQTFDLSEIDLF